jgi:exopolyphosphatase/guanosine-5'-triphosphate,3'-diphosphate pyrophosphatase
VGGGSSEIAVGTVADGVSWSRSFPVGSGSLTDRHRREDPAVPAELAAMRAEAEAAFAVAVPPPAALAFAVGGSAASLRRLAGPRLAHADRERALDVLCSAPAEAVAAEWDFEPERVRLLPAGILVLGAAAARLGLPLQIACGGLREGVLLELSNLL